MVDLLGIFASGSVMGPPLVTSLYIQMLLIVIEIILIVPKRSGRPFSKNLRLKNQSID